MTLHGKTALVTGSSRGIGRAIAEKLAGLGANVIVHYGNNSVAALETEAKLKEFGVKVALVKCDFTKPELFTNFIQDVRDIINEWGGGLDILINNAAVFYPNGLAQATFDTFDEKFTANLKYPFFLTKELFPNINDCGRIINVTSYSASMPQRPFLVSPIYAMTKAALNHFTVTLSAFASPRKITVNGVVPVFVQTDMMKDHQANTFKLPEGSSFAKPSDIANIVEFLVSDAGQWVTGQFITCTQVPV